MTGTTIMGTDGLAFPQPPSTAPVTDACQDPDMSRAQSECVLTDQDVSHQKDEAATT